MLSQVSYVQRYFAYNGAVLQINFQPKCHTKEIKNFEWIMKFFNMIGMEKTVISKLKKRAKKKNIILNSKSLNPLDPFHQPTNPSGLIFLYLTDLVEY